NITHEFADNFEVDDGVHAQPQRTKRAQRFTKLDWSHIGVDAQSLAQCEQTSLGPAIEWKRIPLCTANSTQQNGIGFQATYSCVLRERLAVIINGVAAER